MNRDTAFHEGELEIQAKSGARQQARMTAGAIQRRIPEGAMHFIGQQAMAVVASRDADGRVWASLLFGAPGFLYADDERHVRLHRGGCHTAADDPIWRNLAHDPVLGILLIELSSRRRLRINGRVRREHDDYLVEVERAYPNCPKYIQARQLLLRTTVATTTENAFTRGDRLTSVHCKQIAGADTFFVASAHPQAGYDASHRGGRPGFVEVLNERRLRIPEYSGNGMFNTLGNFSSYPCAGLVFPDFENNRLLQLSGRVRILWHETAADESRIGPSCYWEFELESWRESAIPVELEWRLLDYSPHLPPVAGEKSPRLSLRLANARLETDCVRVIELVSTDGVPLPAFEPGAHLPLRVRDASGDEVERQYSLISDHRDHSRYRIAVQLETDGRGGSRYLHRNLKVGDVLHAGTPVSAFNLEASATHSILIAGGIGVTPILSMAHALHAAGRSFELHYIARYYAGLAFRDEIERNFGAHAHLYASREPGGRRLDLDSILKHPDNGYHVYVCGPRSLIQAVHELATSRGWSPDQIHFESFGAGPGRDDQPIVVTLARSGRKIVVPPTRSILDALLQSGVEVPHDCKRGECSLCSTRVLEGQPDHRDLCLNSKERKASMCVCVSRTRGASLTLDL
jgi:ferredoxin-NADP reductase/predicted pyridoxine 5'-phosphate oxidase superfamily flavin-nucleotide-binding protein